MPHAYGDSSRGGGIVIIDRFGILRRRIHGQFIDRPRGSLSGADFHSSGAGLTLPFSQTMASPSVFSSIHNCSQHSAYIQLLATSCLTLLATSCLTLLAIAATTTGEAAPPRILSFTVDETQLPVDGRPWLSWETTNADTLSLSPGIGDVTSFTDQMGVGNGVPPAPVSRFRFVDLNEDWLYLDDGTDLSNTDWQTLAFNDQAWPVGPAPLGYGDANATALEFGGDANNKFVTYYFRKTFDVAQDSIDRTDVLYLELQRDDGAIVYLNGTEILRDNLPAAAVDADTRASVATAGDAETQIFRYIIDKGLLQVGENIFAAEVHQASAASSDLIFDAGMFSARATAPVSVIEFNSVWRYLDDGSNLADSGWEQSDFNDSDWTQGSGEFGYDSTVESTILEFGDDSNNKHTTYYFRRTFLVGDVDAASDLYANLLYDDGAVVYINGVEVARVNLPDGPIGTDTFATTPSTEGVYERLELSDSVPFLLNGENTLAVEIHQASPGSSDVSFDIDLVSADSNSNETTLIERRALWRFDDSGVDRGPSNQDPDLAWFGPQFDHSNWKAGPAELGYGDGGDGAGFPTLINFGPDPMNKPLTTYFRHRFEMDAGSLEGIETLALSLQRDDGAVVYLNGDEIVRDNVDEGDVDALTPALSASATTTSWTIDVDRLTAGTNTLAVEVHQQAPTSSDLFFDMRLIGIRSADSITYTLTATNDEGSTTAQVTVDYRPVVDGSPLPLTPVFLTTPHPVGVDWTFAAPWSNRRAPSADQSYIVHGNFASTIRSPQGVIDPEFGASLTLSGSRSRLVLGHANGSTARIPELILRKGSVWHSVAGAFLQVGEPGSTVTIDASANFSHASVSGRRVLAVGSDLLGTGTITVTEPSVINGSTATLFLGDGSGFTGNWIIEDTVGAVGANALGSGDISITGNGALDFDYDYHNATGTITLEGSTSQLVVDHIISVGTLTVRGINLPDGVYSGAAIEALGQNFVDRGGQMIIAGENPDTDGDGLIDAWERQHFGSLAQSGMDDFDGDGDSNAKEEIARTDPIDSSSRFQVAVSQPFGNGGVTPVLTLSWPGSESLTYLLQVSEDLKNWRVVSLVPGVDGSTSFSDNDNFPPASNAAPLYYRVLVNGS